MTTTTISHLIKPVPVIGPEDTIRRAAGLIRASEGSRLVVQESGRILGTISEQAIAASLSRVENTDSVLDSPIGPLVETNPTFINSGATLTQAAEVFAATGFDVLPVIDNHGCYWGAIYRRDVIGFLTKNLRPPTVAGMATPLGVYLTTGSLSGGASSFGLFLTGASLAFMIVMASLIVEGLQKLLTSVTGIRSIYAAFPALGYAGGDVALYLPTVLSVFVFFLLLRLSPLSGYHAAEHMTVHAMEAGDTLTSENVRRMPRVHPRCGTNLLAAAGVFVMLTTRINNQFSVLVAMLVVIVGWRAVGGWMQYFVTTRTPSERQLASGVSAGQQLMKRYQERPNYQVFGFRRIWNMGFLQTGAGMATMLWFLQDVLKIPMM